MIYSDLYKEGLAILSEAQISEAALDARLLLEYYCGTNYNTLLVHPDLEVSEICERKYFSGIRKRAEHVPLQHITGQQEFMGLNFKVTPDVLVPRQDTEFVVEEALIYIEDGMKVLDVCTGSGCILLSLMNYKNDITGVGIDISDKALEVARENAADLGLNPTFARGDLFNALDNLGLAEDNSKDLNGGKILFDVIISNPPYIKRNVIDSLMPEVKEHDPMIALDGGEDGLDFYRIIISEAREHLKKYGRIFLEIGNDQGKEVEKLLENNYFTDVKIVKDYSGNDRVALGTLKY